MLSCHTQQPGNDGYLCRMNHEGGQHTCHLLPGQGRHRTELSWGAVETSSSGNCLVFRLTGNDLLGSCLEEIVTVSFSWTFGDVMLCKGHQGAEFKHVR